LIEGGSKFLIGVVHLPRLPNTSYRGEISISSLIDKAVEDASLLVNEGFDAVLIENFGDSPYLKRVRDPLTIASMTVIVKEVVKNVKAPVGINLLRNSGREAYSIAVATGAKFIRVNALVETLVTDSGVIEPEAPKLRSVRINYPGVEIFADVVCKHAASLTFTHKYHQLLGLSDKAYDEALESLVSDLIERGGANAIVVTGLKTGVEPEEYLLKKVKEFSKVPVLIGSGLNPQNAGKLLKYADGAIVGSYIRENGKAGNPISLSRVRELVKTIKNL